MSNEALRYNEGKPRYDLIPWHVLPTAEDHPMLNGMSYLVLNFASRSDPHCWQMHQEAGASLGFLYYRIDPEDLASVYEKGAVKYAPFDWYKGLSASRIMASVSRHLKAYELDEQENDLETGLPHLVHAAWGYTAMLVFLREGRLVNDYYNGSEEIRT